MKKKSVNSLIIKSLGFSFLLAAFMSGSSFAADKIKIGTIMPMSGPLSIVGMSFTRGYEIAAQHINDQGGIRIGPKKFLIELAEEDNKGAEEQSKSSALKLIHRDGAKFILGGILEPSIAAIYKVCEQGNAFYGAVNAPVPGSATDVSPEKKLMARLNLSYDDTHSIDIDYLIKAYPEAKRIAIVTPDIGLDPMNEDFTAKATKRGLDVVLIQKWQWGTTDFVPVMTKVLGSNPDAILSMITAQAEYQLMAANQLGFKGVFISNSPLAPDVFLRVAGPDACNNLICNGVSDKHTNETIDRIRNDWKRLYKEKFVADSLMGYDALWVLAQAIQKAQSLMPERVMAVLETMTKVGDLQTAHGPAKMGGMKEYGCNRVLVRPIPISHLMKGKVVYAEFVMP